MLFGIILQKTSLSQDCGRHPSARDRDLLQNNTKQILGACRSRGADFSGKPGDFLLDCPVHNGFVFGFFHYLTPFPSILPHPAKGRKEVTT